MMECLEDSIRSKWSKNAQISNCIEFFKGTASFWVHGQECWCSPSAGEFAIMVPVTEEEKYWKQI